MRHLEDIAAALDRLRGLAAVTDIDDVIGGGAPWGIRELAEMAEVKRLKNPGHGFRKAHATALEEAGATPSDIMRALGQSSIQVAMCYANASPRRAAERVAMLHPIGPVRPDNVVSIKSAKRRASGSIVC